MMGMGFGFVGMLFFGGILLALAVGGMIVVFRYVTAARPSGGQRQPAARQILDDRLARGEIDAQEYDRIRAQIEA